MHMGRLAAAHFTSPIHLPFLYSPHPFHGGKLSTGRLPTLFAHFTTCVGVGPGASPPEDVLHRLTPGRVLTMTLTAWPTGPTPVQLASLARLGKGGLLDTETCPSNVGSPIRLIPIL